jgi:GDP/UDP-N,N'-diacetylbacillosamine 2-epimerase (hydrolysing)
MKSNKKIAVITGSRADYGHLYPLLKEIGRSKILDLNLIVTGMHLSSEYGETKSQILKDGFEISAEVEMLLSGNSSTAITKSIGVGLLGFADLFKNFHPDLVVILGDRFEMLSAAVAAYINNLNIAHLHGGETTEGAFDEAIRHSITKMSDLHFTATNNYRKRVIQLGESPESVYNVGAIGLDNIRSLTLFSKKSLEKELRINFKKKNLLISYHPETLSSGSVRKKFLTLLSVISELNDTQIIFTKSNADTSGEVINRLIDEYVSRNPRDSSAYVSLGQQKFLSVLKVVDGIVGNSSSGIIEAPSLKTGTINIGNRQKGRDRAESVIDCSGTPTNIRAAIQKLYSAEYQKKLKKIINPYGGSNATQKIMSVLESWEVSQNKAKSFFDIEFIG